MKQKLLLLLVALLTIAMPSHAYDFMVDGLCYNKNSDGKSVTVTFQKSSFPSYSNLSGVIKIPETVTNSGTTYSVTSIGDWAFYECDGLTSVTIPNSVTSIGRVFDSCSGLTSVTIPNSVTSIGDNAFFYCNSLSSVTIPNSVTSIGRDAFAWCTGLKSVTIGNSVTTIGDWAFEDCSGLTSITIPNSVTEIGYRVFEGCSGLTSITIGNSVTSIGNYAFDDCNKLKTVFSLNPTPPTISSDTFNSYNATLYVPTPYIYKNADYWKNFSNIVAFYNIDIDCTYTTALLKQYIQAVDLKLISAVVNGKTFKPASDGTITLSGLQPNTNYTATVKYTENGEQKQADVEFTTQDVLFNSISSKTTQTTAEITYKVARDAGLIIKDFYVKLGGTKYPAAIIETTDDYYLLKCVINGLSINSKYSYNPACTFEGKEFYYDTYKSLTTQGTTSTIVRTISPTAATISAEPNCGDAKLKTAYFTYSGTRNEWLNLTGLKPKTSYSASYTVETENGSQSQSISFTTSELTMTTQAAKMLDNRTPLLMAQTNIADEEVSCGFEWRRYDAPAEMPSTLVYCPVYDGIMSGTIRNMTENVYYKYRPFYKASDGTMYYGDWIAFITADAGIYFEPLVHTYADFLLDLDAGNATIKGVAIRGSETISEQGFEYWWNTTTSNASQLAPSAVNKVKATGERISATLSNLQPGCTYSYRSYVTDNSGTFYGETRSFSVPKPAVSGDLNGDGNVNAGDVSELYSAILRGAADAAYDLNGDGNINAGDISTIYSIILGQ